MTHHCQFPIQFLQFKGKVCQGTKSKPSSSLEKSDLGDFTKVSFSVQHASWTASKASRWGTRRGRSCPVLKELRGQQVNRPISGLREASEEQRAVGGAGGGSSSHCRCLRGSDREELSLPGVLSRASSKGSARKGIRTFWELQGGQGVQKRVPAGKTGGAGEDRVAGSLSDQLKPYGP